MSQGKYDRLCPNFFLTWEHNCKNYKFHPFYFQKATIRLGNYSRVCPKFFLSLEYNYAIKLSWVAFSCRRRVTNWLCKWFWVISPSSETTDSLFYNCPVTKIVTKLGSELSELSVAFICSLRPTGFANLRKKSNTIKYFPLIWTFKKSQMQCNVYRNCAKLEK